MPHLTIDYAAPLDDSHNMQALCQTLFDALITHRAIAHPDALKIRAQPHRAYVIGTDPQTFAHAQLRLLPGRDDATKAELTALVLNVLNQAMPDVGSLTVEACDMHAPSYAKRVL